ncbi:MAG: hypothetical protein HYW25_01600 [Candidatus Aenigmarchaeota archaeon]|nr:hypothetical protein [Candidatus Aenigmarchaeota archaeon]
MKIFGQIKRTPKFARELVEKVVIENLGISDNDWRRGQPISYDANPNPMRPPYGAWARNKGGYSKMAIQESGARISYGEDPFGRALEFREYSVIDVK